MSYWKANLPAITIASGASVSTSTPSGALDDALSIAIFAPATLTTGCKVQGSNDGGSTFQDILSGGTVITVTQAQVVELSGGLPYDMIRVTSVAISEATARSLTVAKVFVVS